MIELNKLLFIHTPKTGGGSMEQYFYNKTKKIRRNYFLSFNGTDDSRYIQDERSTQRNRGNKTVIEKICSNQEIVDIYNKSRHFAEAKMLFGHASMALPNLFPSYNFEIMMVLREPIERTISNICQFSTILDGKVKFGNQWTEHKKYTKGYWDFVYEILNREYPIQGFSIHENLYLRNCMCHIINGNTYKTFHTEVNLDEVFNKIEKINISFYDDFNKGLQSNFNHLNIPIDMSANYIPINSEKTILGKYYGATDKIIELISANNQYDIELYQHLHG